MTRLALGSDVGKSSWRELGLLVSELKLVDGWLSSSLVLPTSGLIGQQTLLRLQSCCHISLHGHSLETKSVVLLFHFVVSLLFLFSSDVQTCVWMEPRHSSAREIGTLPTCALP